MSFGIRTRSKGIDAGFEALVLSETYSGKLMDVSNANDSLFGGKARDLPFGKTYAFYDAPVVALKAAPSNGSGLMGALGLAGSASTMNGVHLMPWSPYPIQGAQDFWKATGKYEGDYNPPVDLAIASRLAEDSTSGYGMAIRNRDGRTVFSSNEKNYLKVLKTTVLDPLDDFEWGDDPSIALKANIDAIDGYENYFIINTRPFQKHLGYWWSWTTYTTTEYQCWQEWDSSAGAFVEKCDWVTVQEDDYYHSATNAMISSVGINTSETSKDSVQLHYCGAGMDFYFDGVLSDESGTPEMGEDFLYDGGESEEKASDFTTKIIVKEVTFDAS